MVDSLVRMVARRFAVWQKVVALAPLALLLVYLPGQMMLRCRIDGSLRPACCCPERGEQESSQSTVKAQDCCDRLMTGSARPIAEASRAEKPDLAPTAVVSTPLVFFALVEPPAPRADWSWQSHGPPRGGPGLVVLKHAFLI